MKAFRVFLFGKHVQNVRANNEESALKFAKEYRSREHNDYFYIVLQSERPRPIKLEYTAEEVLDSELEDSKEWLWFGGTSK